MAKEIHLAKWNGNTLVYSIPNKNNPERLADFQGPSKIFSYSYPSFQHHHFTYPDDPEILEVFDEDPRRVGKLVNLKVEKT